MNKYFANYEQSLMLKELGFNEPCFTHYLNEVLLIKSLVVDEREKNSSFDNTRVTAPLKAQVFKWFRDNYNLVHRINRDGGYWICALLDLYDEDDQGAINIYIKSNPQTYEKAEDICIDKLIEIVKQKTM